MADRKTISFDAGTWLKGTRGQVATAASDGRPSLVNMRLYPDGGLGPRPRWRRWGNTASGGAIFYGDTNQGHVQFVRFTTSTPSLIDQRGLVVVGSSNTRGHYISGGSHQTLSNIATVTAQGGPFIDRITDTQWMMNGLYIVTNGNTNISVTSAQAALATRFGLTAADFRLTGQAIHQGRSYFSGPSIPALSVHSITAPNRVYYSDANAYATFTSATQFFDVDGYIQGMASTGNNLLIWTREGIWYVLQGRGNPANGTLTKLGPGQVPHKYNDGTTPNLRDNLLFSRSGRNGLVSVGSGGGMDDAALAHLAFVGTADSTNYSVRGAASGRHGTAIIPDQNTAMAAYVLNRGSWSYETWGMSSQNASYAGMDEDEAEEALFLYVSGSGWAVYRRPMFITAPEAAISGDAFAETPTGIVRLPRIMDPMQDTKITRVIIDARYWKGASYDAPDMDVLVGTGFDGPTSTFVQGPSDGLLSGLANESGIEVRLEYTPDGAMPFSHMNDVVIQNITSIVIDKVTVEFETTRSY